MTSPAYAFTFVAAFAALPLAFLSPQPATSSQPTTSAPPPPSVTERLRSEAEMLRPLVTSDLARAFLDATATLPDPGTRAVMRNREKNLVISTDAFEKLPEAEQAGYTKREISPAFYYYTGYGSPLVFVRPLNLLAQTDTDEWTLDKIPGKRIIDFGCGTIGHLRLLASLGADVTGIDVEPMFDVVYSQPGDQGAIATATADVKGYLRFLTGQWPAQPDIMKKVTEHAKDGYDLFISKNTLKRGYIHPAREIDPSRLVHLGVSDEIFVKSVYDALKPGGVFLIYNIAPAQTPPDQPYLPHADGECPFPRDLLEKAGFTIVKFDENDQDGLMKYWMKLGYNQGKEEAEAKKDLFVWWTMCRKDSKSGS